MFLKKGIILLLSAMLLLAGCAGEASLVRDAVVQSVENPNYDYQGTLKLTGNIDELLELSGEEVDEEAQAVLDAIEAGLTIRGSQLDLNRAKLVLEANDDSLLREKGLWTGDDKAALELLLDTNTTYLKSPIDEKYIAIDPNEMDQSGIDPEEAKAFQEKVNELMIDFLKKYVAEYGFELSDAENLGTETVTLPNGDEVEATHVSITLDTKELINLFLYTAKDATTNPEVRSFAIDLMTAISEFAEANGEEMPFPAEDRKAHIEEMVDEGLAQLKTMVDTLEQTYTVDEMVEMAQEEGLKSLEVELDYYINDDKLPVRTTSTIEVSFEDPSGELSVPVKLGLESDSYIWNYGEATSFTYPDEEDTISIEQLTEEKEVEGLNKDGFLYAIVQEMNKETGMIVFDLNENSTTLNGEAHADVKPYQDPKTGTTMVPFRFIGEAMGADISFDAETKAAIFEKDDVRIVLTNGSSTAEVNGETVTLPQPSVIKDGSLYVPLRFVSEQLGAEVIWIDEVKQVLIQYEK
ncbi:copper amine oxidase N-terminal domain-containing protein [Brevibacillus humidisoli]|uniref:copper amine oxidase N-terminal domain-containing protein n=1 Tax=Brevibacillus humidisoli TaxID=2895522 RepID=UPI001E5AF863|nr:copper amine oxidase N-terminal domain-containing protein [Brevibacillus humidisoli]UFJ39347.1 copper amine oxidase N-terminal domain-containing protein [Brevibacillus humidisoli]